MAGVPGRAADPVAQAKTGVAEAERTLAAFEAERARAVRPPNLQSRQV